MPSVFKTRNAYFPSSGGASGPTPAAYWTDVSQMQSLAGVWDSPSGSPDTASSVTKSGSVFTTGSILAFQYTFPAFGSVMDFSTPPAPNTWLKYGIPTPIAAAMYYTKTGTPTPVIYPFSMLRVFDSTHTLKWQSLNPPTSSGNSLTLSPITHAFSPAGFPGSAQTTTLVATDYMVIECGYYYKDGPSVGSSAWSFHANAAVGDGHLAYLVTNTTAAGNSGAVMGWYGVPLAVAGNVGQYRKSLFPVRSALRIGEPVADRTNDILNGFIL